MTIKIFVLKGDLNGEIVVVRFFFCWVYFLPILAAISVTIATVKDESIPDLYTLAIVLIN